MSAPSAAPATPSALSPEGPWSDPHLLAAVNRMRAATLPAPGAIWVTYHALHPASTDLADFLAVGGAGEKCDLARLDHFRMLRDGLAAGGIDWPAWEV